MADARRRVNAHCPACGSVEWFGQHRAIITGPRGTLTCVDVAGVEEVEWLCNRCGRPEQAKTKLRAVLDRAAARSGALSAR
ncbi:MAG: hypothetical protein ACHQXL_05610 [Candidatus Limnocylindrales bacterium]